MDHKIKYTESEIPAGTEIKPLSAYEKVKLAMWAVLAVTFGLLTWIGLGTVFWWILP